MDCEDSEGQTINRRNYVTLLFRRLSSGFFNGLSQQFVDLYTVGVGISVSSLGSIRSLALLSSALVSSLIGYLADIVSRKTAYIIGMIIEAASAAAFALAFNWFLAALGLVLTTVSFNAIMGIEALILTESTRGRQRAFSIGIADSLYMLASVIAPLIAALLVNRFGGLKVEGIRPLFIIQVIGLTVTLVISSFILVEPRSKRAKQGLNQMVRDSVLVFKRPWLRRWVVIEILGRYVFASTIPYQIIYAVEVKGADEFIIGYMGFVANLATLAFSPIIGKAADKLGRVKTVVILRPLFYISTLMFLLAPSPEHLILAWFIRGVWMASRTPFQALTMELVPSEMRGRWMGVRNFLSLTLGIPAPWLGGIMYESLFPEAPFLASMLIDALLRYPLIYATPETLNREEYLRKYSKK
ncbi:MAG: hypothetical protein DRJ41_00010 [Thermoprotei archaeon]|nr:MAG: hypothetical protein DRJ41_00010 [Thermoprotei archaeon]